MPSSPAPALTVSELAHRVSGAVEGDGSALIQGVSSIEEAQLGDIVFAESPAFLAQASKSRASAVVAFLEATVPDKPLIKVENPRYAFAKILELFMPDARLPIGVHPTAVIGEGTVLGGGVAVGPHVTIGERCRIGDGVRVFAGCVLGDEVAIGDSCILHPRVTLARGTALGERVVVHSGAVLGADGFGYMRIGERSTKVPHVGNVVVGDDVEIGANTTIDRAKTGSTTIGARTKIDNLVHVAHNVKIGEDCILVAQAGIAGSSQVGRGVIVAGQAGIKDHVTIGDGAVIFAQAGVIKDVPAGAKMSGFPARPHRELLRREAAAYRAAELLDRVKRLEQLIERLSVSEGASDAADV